MFWWVFGVTVAVICGPVLFVLVRSLVRPNRRSRPAAPAPPQPPQVNIHVHPAPPRPRRRIKPYSALERDAKANRPRRESIDRRYSRTQPW